MGYEILILHGIFSRTEAMGMTGDNLSNITLSPSFDLVLGPEAIVGIPGGCKLCSKAGERVFNTDCDSGAGPLSSAAMTLILVRNERGGTYHLYGHGERTVNR